METKPSIKTSEFWITAITNVLALLQLNGVNVVADIHNSQNKYVLIGLAILNAGYAISRGQAKQGVAYTGE